MTRLRSIASCLLLFALASCGGASDAPSTASVLQRGISSDPETLDQHRSRSIQAADVIRDLGEGLLGYSATGELVPAAAASWEVSEDGLKYTFHLRDGLRWSNGDALTASHFVAGMRRLVDPSTAAFYAEMLGDLENAAAITSGDIPVSMLGVEAPDERTVVLRLVQQTPYLISLMTHPSTFPIHPGSIAEHGESFARPGKLVSNGAYRLEAWLPGSIISLRRN